MVNQKGQLFSDYFLEEGIVGTPQWQDLEDNNPIFLKIREIASKNLHQADLNEANTELLLIEPILDLLGYTFLREKSPDRHGRTDVPDYLLFADRDKRSEALKNRQDAFKHGCSILEAKKLDRRLDRGDATDPVDPRVPANQMLRYMSSCSIASLENIRFGILTNGRLWRLYDHIAASRADAFIEIDLFSALGLAGSGPSGNDLEDEDKRRHALRLFVLLFRRAALPLPHGDGLLIKALDAGRHFEAQIAESLRDVVFGKVFARLANALAAGDTEAAQDPSQVYQASLVFLYRLLFLFYAEDRGLLPAGDYSLTRIREDAAQRKDRNDVFSDRAARYDTDLQELFRIIDKGDDSIGIPPYDGGLFESGAIGLLDSRRIPDSVLADVIDELSRVKRDGSRRWVNYRDLDVRRLGSIYEGLLEHRLERTESGDLALRHDTYARRNTGSYYTHDDLVHLCIREALEPLVSLTGRRFEKEADRLRHGKRTRKERAALLARFSPADAVLDLKVLDPAMGSGHFLVAVVDFLADQVLELMERAAGAGKFCGYVSPLEGRITKIRDRVLSEAKKHGWDIDPSRLEDRHIVKRMVLKRVIYGVDLNPMAVELAKVSLWLSSFTVGAPLSFLDHHLKCGNSLVGSDIKDLSDLLGTSGLLGSGFQGMLNAAGLMEDIADLTDTDIADVRESARYFKEVHTNMLPFQLALDLLTAHDFMVPMNHRQAKAWMSPRSLVSGDFGDPIKVADGEAELGTEVDALREQALQEARRLRFLHFKLAFPEVWWHGGKEIPDPGFDVVIGNPPWDRIKLQENEFFALRDPEIAGAGRASDRKRMIRTLQAERPGLWDEYKQASGDAARLARYTRGCGRYPLLSRGDANLYALFIERAAALLRRHGRMSLVLPSGIVADKEKSLFFQKMVEEGRVASIYDFENGHRGGMKFFPEVDRRFKFCVFTLRGAGADAADKPIRCGFFLHHVDQARNSERTFTLTPKQVALINPNTLTLPVFRSQRDADLTAAIFERVPVLVRRDEKGAMVDNPWGIRFHTMFHMTNDSLLFRTAKELEADGFYRVREDGQPVYRKGDERYVRLYEGKMVQAYDHRAATIKVNLENVHRPAQPRSATLEDHADPHWTPDPRFWVTKGEVVIQIKNMPAVLGFKAITAPTNMRTIISSLHPYAGFGNSLFMLLPENREVNFLNQSSLLQAMLSCFVVDYVARQKVQGQNLNFFIVEQLPVLPPAAFDARIGSHRLAEWVSRQVLELTYVSEDMRPFARAMGYAGDPFPWDPERRLHLVSRLDALFFHLYGVDPRDAAYILDTFPIVREKDEKAFGHYRTRKLVLGYMNAVAAGDLDAVIDG